MKVQFTQVVKKCTTFNPFGYDWQIDLPEPNVVTITPEIKDNRRDLLSLTNSFCQQMIMNGMGTMIDLPTLCSVQQEKNTFRLTWPTKS